MSNVGEHNVLAYFRQSALATNEFVISKLIAWMEAMN